MIICESQREAQGGKEVSGERGEGWWGSGVQIEEEKVELIANTNGPNECRVESSRGNQRGRNYANQTRRSRIETEAKLKAENEREVYTVRD